MRSAYELDCYFESKRFIKRLDFFRQRGGGYDLPGALFIVSQFELMHYHYGIIRHYILTGQYSPEEKNRLQFEIIDYTNRDVVGIRDSKALFANSDLDAPLEGVWVYLPPGTTQKDLIEFARDKGTFKRIKMTLDKAYKGDPGNKHSFRPVKNIDKYLKIVDQIDKAGKLSPSLCRDLSIEYSVDEADIRKFYKKLGSQNNPFLNPV